ncbi:sce7726 family protein [Streptosporangium algeriense]|uniref:Sce7726 family protein n=1 Tax=Streptosporangium algeriense TaxID=1682748 RepID=A0ABW3DK34_9ACTN
MARLMRDSDIRAVLTAQLQRDHDGDSSTLIRQEMGLCAGERRIDIAVINGQLGGFEIKSDYDTLARLADQATAYGRVLDQATLVTTQRYLTPATDILPDWWQIMCAQVEEAGVTLTSVRAGQENEEQDPMAVAQLLWRDEALQELRARGLAQGMTNKRRWLIWERLAAEVPLPELKQVVRDRLRVRQEWPGGR